MAGADKKGEAELPPLAERRPVARRKVILGGLASDPAGHEVIPCQIRDISAMGARINVARHHMIPPELLLVTVKDRVVHPARLIWRLGDQAGVAFLKIPAETLGDQDIPQSLAQALDKEKLAFIKWR
jgi:PilZ domain